MDKRTVLLYNPVMGIKPISFRCPVDLIERLDYLSMEVRCSRNAVIINAIQLLCQEVRERGGYVIPSYSYEISLDDPLFAFLEESEKLPPLELGPEQEG